MTTKKYSITLLETTFETNDPEKFWAFVKHEMKLDNLRTNKNVKFVADKDTEALTSTEVESDRYFRCINVVDSEGLKQKLREVTDLAEDQIELFVKNEAFAAIKHINTLTSYGVFIDVTFSQRALNPELSSLDTDLANSATNRLVDRILFTQADKNIKWSKIEEIKKEMIKNNSDPEIIKALDSYSIIEPKN
jgi:hypothetical protein